MQQPTLRNVRIRSTRDAIAVFHAVARNTLPLITRRLDAEERLCISAGTVFVWEENANSEATGLGMERWTDGMGWGPSRVRDDFLFYHQKDMGDGGDQLNLNPVAPWAQMMRRRASRVSGISPPSTSRKPTDSQRLIKQTYSVLVTLPQDRAAGLVRKWHLTAYFNQETLNELDTIDDLRYLDVPVPEGWFRSARATKARRENRTIFDHAQLSEGTASSPTSPNFNRTTAFAPPGAQTTRYRGLISSPDRRFGCPAPLSSPQLPDGMPPCMSIGRLVPLEYLQNAPPRNRRDPIDEQLLRRFAPKS
ncbi:Gti1/Pac2 family-domain-containing protein [Favolaschia claudopus]|uniref:Gti1/Pac2 family-domain-containing protein n=1 Tax=Favolaschia claudopus TaxID=2862362 RepID=A0AAW0D6K5_9AGAR